MEKPETTGRQQGGKFAPGASGNPDGRPHGARHKISRAVESLLEGEYEALSRKVVEKALEGDMIALRLCLDRIAPAKKDSPVSVVLPPVRTAADAVEASAALLKAVAAGDVTPDEAGRVMALLTAHKGLLETGELEEGIVALEEKAK